MTEHIIGRSVATPEPAASSDGPAAHSCRNRTCACRRPCRSVGVASHFMQAGREFRFSRGEELWNVGDPADSLVVICIGHMKLALPAGDHLCTLQILSRGSMVGEEAALGRMHRVARCVALSPGRAVRLGGAELRSLLDRKPELAHELLEISAQRSATFAARLGCRADGSVRERLAKVLLELGEGFGNHDGQGVFVPIRLTRGDLAELAGCRVETVIRTLSAWRSEDLVDVRREGITIADLQRLHDEAGHA